MNEPQAPISFDGLILKKIVTADRARHLAAGWQFHGKKVVFTNGCFDLLHPGHLHLLHSARDFGHYLIVGVNSDASAARLKPGRPIQDENTRTYHLAGLEAVDLVILFDEDTPFELISMLKPDVLVKGGDYSPGQVVGREIVLNAGGTIQIVPLLEKFSTTALLKKIQSLQQ